MPYNDLTAKQEAFCLNIVKGMNASDAYRAAGYSAPNAKAVHEAASRLSKNPKVQARIEELRGPAAAEAALTLETHLLDLQRLRNAAVQKGQLSAAISAEIARGRVMGFYDSKRGSPEDPVHMKLDQPAGPRVIVIGGGQEEGVREIMDQVEAMDRGGVADAALPEEGGP